MTLETLIEKGKLDGFDFDSLNHEKKELIASLLFKYQVAVKGHWEQSFFVWLDERISEKDLHKFCE